MYFTKTLPKDQSAGGSLWFIAFITIGFVYFLFNAETTLAVTPIKYASREVIAKPVSQIFSPSVLYWEEEIYQWSDEWDLDVNLIATVIQIESCGDPQALSGAGAIGLFQVMPYHFQNEEDPFATENNSKRGLGYLKKASQTYSTNKLIFASYNGGIFGASLPEDQWQDETMRYVYWGINISQDANKNLVSSPVLDEWMTNGGAHLCDQANRRLANID